MSEREESLAFKLLRDVVQGKASLWDKRRLYEAAAESRKRSPELAEALQKMADRAGMRDP